MGKRTTAAAEPGLHVWVSSFVYDSCGKLLRSFEVQAESQTSLLDGVAVFFSTRWFSRHIRRLVLDRTPEPGCYVGMVEASGLLAPEITRTMVQIRMRRSHRLADEGEPWWLPEAGPLDGLMPLDVGFPSKPSGRVRPSAAFEPPR